MAQSVVEKRVTRSNRLVVQEPEPTLEQDIKGVIRLDEHQMVFQRRVVLALTILPFLGFVAAVAWLWGNGLSVVDVSIFVALHAFTGLGITVGYHRLLTHKSFETPQWILVLFAFAGSMAIEGSAISWVAAHRRHHAFADKEGDPHSPHLVEGAGLKAVAKGLWYAHVGWFFDEEKTSLERWAPDLMKNRAIRRVDKYFPYIAVFSFVLPALLGYAFTQSLGGAISAFLWAGLTRILLLHHVTWSVNSICHFYGRRPFQTTDESTNNWPLAIISFGESWHNNHHAFPTSAMHGLKGWQVDPGALVIRSLERLGLAWDVKRVTEKQLARMTGAPQAPG